MEAKLPHNVDTVHELIPNTIPISYKGRYDNRINATKPENSGNDFPEYIAKLNYRNQRTLEQMRKQVEHMQRNPKTAEIMEGMIRVKTLVSLGMVPLFKTQLGLDVYTLIHSFCNILPRSINALVFDSEVYNAINNVVTNYDNTLVLSGTLFGIDTDPNMESYTGIDNTGSLSSQNNITDLLVKFQDRATNLLVSVRDLNIEELTNLIILILNTMAVGGNAVIRLSDPYTNPVACLVYLLTTMFTEVSMVSPITQRTSDFGLYLVLKKFRTIGARSVESMTAILTQYSLYVGLAAAKPGLFSEVWQEYLDSYRTAYNNFIEAKHSRIQNMAVLLNPYMVPDVRLDPIADMRILIETATRKWTESVGFSPVKKGGREQNECERGCNKAICPHLGNQIRSIMNSKSDFYKNKIISLFGFTTAPQNVKTDADYYALIKAPVVSTKSSDMLYPEYLSDSEINEYLDSNDGNQISFQVFDVDEQRSRITASYLDIVRITEMLVNAEYSEIIGTYYSRYMKLEEWAEHLSDMLIDRKYVLRETKQNPRFGYATLIFQRC